MPSGSVEAYRTADYWQKFAHVTAIAGAGAGDANGDGRISISDVTGLIDLILSGDDDVWSNPYLDVNGDGKVSIADVTALIYALLKAG